ncbi:MAG: HTH-type transcriptional regulator, sugar sensing transcriptional regulator [Candidatus Cloacimonadota bacterium]|nr:HTH-type transcriptional regulator, sugar sensing transcriptional regulator [Candidatus Cloacimonadota bacterium]
MSEKQKEQLMKFGLTKRESIIVLSLIKTKPMVASEIAKLTKIPRSKIYDILDKLVNKGLCKEHSEGKVKKYSAENPHKSLPQMIKKKMKLYEDMYEEASAIGKELLVDYNDYSYFGYEFVHIVKDSQDVVERYKALYSESRETIKEFVKSPYSMAKKDIVEVKKINKMLIDRGVRIQNINEKKDLDSDLIKTATQWHIDAGVEIRLYNNLPMKLSIFDDKVAMYILNNPITLSTELTTIFVEHSGFVEMLKCAFNEYWKSATSVSSLIKTFPVKK